MKRKLLSLLLVVAMVLAMVPAALAADTTETDAGNLPQSNGNTLRLWYDEPVGNES